MSYLTAQIAFFLSLGVYVVNCYYFEQTTKAPQYVTAAVGDHIVLNCEIDFPHTFPIPYEYYWKHGGKVIFSWEKGETIEADEYVGRIRMIDEYHQKFYGLATINLTSIRESDAGWYQCQVVFPNRNPPSRNNGTWYHLTVSDGNLLAIPPINHTVQEKEAVNFTCLAKDYSVKIRWKKDGIPLREYHDLMRRSRVEKDGTLFINPTDMGDNGEYECEAINAEGDRQVARAFLNVQYKAKVVFAPPEIHLPFGRSAIIDCHFRANPPLTNLRWEKDGFLFDPYNIQGVFYRKNGSLYFNKVDETHIGSYTCTPFNDLGTQGPSPAMYIYVQRAPVFITTPHNLYLKKLGETLEMPCDARDGESAHRPMIVWYKKGSSLPLGRNTISEGNLTITDIREEDRGVYLCSVTNKAATITAETELLVENVPSSAPHNITAVSSPTSVHVTWLAGRQRVNVEFSIWYKKIENTEWKTYAVPSSDALEATVTNLEPGTEYEFMVLCKDDSVDGLFSKSVRVKTKEMETATMSYRSIIGYPRNVRVAPIDNGLLVAWEPPQTGFENLKWYNVRWSQGPEDYIFGSDETTNTTYMIRNLSEGMEYDVQIVAVAYDDQQAVSEKVRVLYPGFKSIRAVSTGIITGLVFLGAAFIAVFYVKKKCVKQYPQENLKS